MYLLKGILQPRVEEPLRNPRSWLLFFAINSIVTIKSIY
jgi:hypothetical protein